MGLTNILNFSHDKLTRLLSLKIPWKIITKSIIKIFNLKNGYLIFDETDINKSYASVIQGLSWIYSHRFNRYIFGYHIVVIAWTNNKITIPLGWKMYQLNGKDTKTELALELLIYCLDVLEINPTGILFDSFYASEKILKYISNRGITFYTQIPKNRLFEGKQLKYHKDNRPYWNGIGKIKGKIRVKIVKHRKKYFMTNKIDQNQKEIRRIYSIRWRIEEIFRFVKQDLGLEKCECRKLQKQCNHINSCFSVYAILQDTILNTGLNEYEIKEKVINDHKYLDFIFMHMAFD